MKNNKKIFISLISAGVLFIASLSVFIVSLTGRSDDGGVAAGNATLSEYITIEYRKKYAEIGRFTKLPAAFAADGYGRPCEVIGTLTYNGQAVEITGGGFTPLQEGEYLYTAAAVAGGAELKKSALIVAVPYEDARLEILAEFNEEYGLKHVAALYGATAEYSTAYQYREDRGSLMFTPAAGAGEFGFKLKDVLKPDLTFCKEVWFGVYNGGDAEVKVSVNGGKVFTVVAGYWNYNWIGDLSELNHTIDNINGLSFKVYKADGTPLPQAPVCFSAVYAVDKIMTERVVEMFDAVPDPMTDADEPAVIAAKNLYFRQGWYQQALLYRQYYQFSDKYSRYLSDKYNFQSGRVFAFDNIGGVKQVDLFGCTGSFDADMKYAAAEAGSLKLVSNGDWYADVYFRFPVKSEYEGKSEMYFYVYSPYADDVYCANFWGTYITLKNGWNRISRAIDLRYLFEARVRIKFTDETRMPQGAQFYISPVYAQ